MLNVEKFSHGKLDWNGHVSSAHHGPDITVLPLLTRRPWKPLKRDKNKHMEIYEVLETHVTGKYGLREIVALRWTGYVVIKDR